MLACMSIAIVYLLLFWMYLYVPCVAIISKCAFMKFFFLNQFTFLNELIHNESYH